MSSSLWPEFEKRIITSLLTIIPKSPWLASPGCMKKAGVPVLDKVDEIFRAIWPDFPIPLSTTLPLQPTMALTASTKLSPILFNAL